MSEESHLETLSSTLAEIQTKVESGASVNAAHFAKLYKEVQEEKANRETWKLEQTTLNAKLHKEVQEELIQLNKRAATPVTFDKNAWKKEEHYQQLTDYLRFGNKVTLALQSDIDTKGGYLIPSQMSDQVLIEITEKSNFRSHASMIRIDGKSLDVPVRVDNLTGAKYEGELDEAEEAVLKFRNEELTTYRQTSFVPLTAEMMKGSSFDIESMIMQYLNDDFMLGEDRGIATGLGNKSPSGFANDQRIEKVIAPLSFDTLVTAKFTMKTGQNPVWFMNRTTFGLLWNQKDNENRPLITQYSQDENFILGIPVQISQQMPDVGSEDASVTLADMKRGYLIADRTGMTIIRDEFTGATRGVINIVAARFNTGRVVLPEAFVNIISATVATGTGAVGQAPFVAPSNAEGKRIIEIANAQTASSEALQAMLKQMADMQEANMKQMLQMQEQMQAQTQAQPQGD